MQPTKDIVVYAKEVPSIDDAMAVLHKLPYQELIALAGMLAADVDKIAQAAEEYQMDWANQQEERKKAAPMPSPGSLPSAFRP